ncbi:MAG: hypothetical protein HFE27_00010 [Clostridia bacterium]|jgi:hypothetical protein|nr:hypothetical protein [Clostridia bacterium]
MKSTKKVILSACLAALFACVALVSGVMLGLSLNKSTRPDSSSLATTSPDTITTPAKLKLTSDSTGITPGGSIVIKIAFSAPAGAVWYAMQTTIAPLTADGTAIDRDIAQYLSLDATQTKLPARLAMENGDFSMPFNSYAPSVHDKFSETDGNLGILFLAAKGLGGSMNTDVEMNFEITLKLAENAPIDTIDSLTFGISPEYPDNFITTIPSESQANNQTDYTTDESTYASNRLTFSLREANTEAEIESIKLKVDTQDETGNPDFEEYLINSTDFVSGNYALTLPDTDDLNLTVFYPTMKTGSEGATVKAGATSSSTAVPASLTALTEEGVDITVSGTNRILYVQATPEDGNTANQKIYKITLTFTYARLSNLIATSSGFTDTSITKFDLELGESGVFDPDTFEYIAYVPEGTTSTEVKPTLATDYGIATTVRVVKDGNYTMLGGSTSVNNESSLFLQNISNNEKISFELTAQDGTTKKTYKITFEIVTTDTSLDSIVVKGNTSDAEIPNNEEKAQELGKDYYYSIGDDPAQAKITITTTDENATVEIAKVGEDGTVGEYTEYDPNAVYDVGEYVIKVTASAGNSEEYTLVLDQFDGFELDENSEFALIALIEDTTESGKTVHYRRTYEELNWVHGVNDRNVERYVLGEIVAGATLTDLVANFSSAQLNKINVYANDGAIIYEGNNGGIVSGNAGLTICTGWKIQYGTGAAADIIYVSILGDVSGDGRIRMADAADIGSYVAGNQGITFEDLEVKLAAYIGNNGSISMRDSANISSIVAGNAGVTIETYLRKNAQS